MTNQFLCLFINFRDLNNEYHTFVCICETIHKNYCKRLGISSGPGNFFGILEVPVNAHVKFLLSASLNRYFLKLVSDILLTKRYQAVGNRYLGYEKDFQASHAFAPIVEQS